MKKRMGRCKMAKGTTRVNGKHGESMWVTDEDLCFRTGGKVRKIALGDLSYLSIDNAEDTRRMVTQTELVPYGAWTDAMPSTKGRSVFLVAQDSQSCFVMETAKSQLPTAQNFVLDNVPDSEDKKDQYDKIVPGRAIDTPLGGVFTILSVLCVIAATFLVFSFEQPVLALIVAIAGLVMHFLIK